jgi:lipopolysaccharide/colanic/teichoic acid biosynthesis glycosyltransferase
MRPGKRALDLAGSLLGLALLWPLFLAIGLAVALGDRGSVFFRQERVGHRGRRFRIWKFRTMAEGAELQGGALTVGHDPRITRVGRWLRRYKLDELPQLLNVVAGEMSLVGPRPEVPQYVALYSAEQRRVLELVPGITDPASIGYWDEAALLARAPDPARLYEDQVMPDKIRLNLEYAARATVRTDLLLILRTLLRLLPTRRDLSVSSAAR